MSELGLVVLCSYIAIFSIGLLSVDRLQKQLEKTTRYWKEDRDNWMIERGRLIDRIQAPSFDHLKQAEIRKIKAEKEEPVERVELL